MPKAKSTKADKVVKKLERSFGSKLKLVIAGGAVLALGVSSFFATSSSKPSQTVKITNMAQNSGGSGVIYASSPGQSVILTNNHICEVIRRGGYVETTTGSKHFVISFKQSAKHDVCSITVNTDFGVYTEVAPHAPEMFEKAVISGHPALLPTVLAEGHFTSKQTIHLLHSFRKCTDKERQNPELGMICFFTGGKLPIFKAFESVVVTAMIMGGSSGSAVYDSSGDIAGLVFAGSGKGLSYAYIVPHEYVYNFVWYERDNVKAVVPDYTVDIGTLIGAESEVDKAKQELADQLEEILLRCESVTSNDGVHVRDICKKLESSKEITL